MKILFIVLNKTEVLDKLMVRLLDAGVKGATIIHSSGMARSLVKSDESPIIASLRMLLDPNKEENRTIFSIINDEQVETVKKVLVEVVGDLSLPDTAIIFTVPIDYAEGMKI